MIVVVSVLGFSRETKTNRTCVYVEREILIFLEIGKCDCEGFTGPKSAGETGRLETQGRLSVRDSLLARFLPMSARQSFSIKALDWLDRFTHLTEGNHLYSKSIHLNVNLIQKIPS